MAKTPLEPKRLLENAQEISRTPLGRLRSSPASLFLTVWQALGSLDHSTYSTHSIYSTRSTHFLTLTRLTHSTHSLDSLDSLPHSPWPSLSSLSSSLSLFSSLSSAGEVLVTGLPLRALDPTSNSIHSTHPLTIPGGSPPSDPRPHFQLNPLDSSPHYPWPGGMREAIKSRKTYF